MTPSEHPRPHSTQLYHDLGVSAGKEDVHAAIKASDPGLSRTLFCKALPDVLGGDPEYCNISHADGAGTKTSLAYAYWKETGDLSVFAGVVQDSIVMNVDDLLCIGAYGKHAPMLLSAGLERNKAKIPGEVVSAIIDATEKYLQLLRSYGIHIHSCGGETADVGDLSRTLSINHTITTRMPRARLVDTKQIAEGDCIIGLASFGQTKYESEYNAGIGSNGLTLARHGIFSRAVAEKYPETFDPALGAKAYFGPHALLDPLPGTPLTLGKAVLSPTRTYAPVVIDVLSCLGSEIHGLVHCSGGGQTKVGKFLEGRDLMAVKDSLFEPPPLFKHIQATTHASWREMYEVFNMGHRLEVYCAPEHADTVLRLAQAQGVEAKVVGRVEAADAPGRVVKIGSAQGTFVYPG